MVVFDRFGRPLLQLRFAVTSRCNFNCFFCHMEGFKSMRPELCVEDIEVVAEACRRLGLRSVKLTGGEPLLREDLLKVVEVFKSRGFNVSITTNGYYLSRYAYGLAELGVDHINVSLHSLKREVFKRITGVDALHKVVEGIRRAHELGIQLKINLVVLRGLNEFELESIMDFASKYAKRLQVIELHTPTDLDNLRRYHVPYAEVFRRLAGRASRVAVRRDLHNRIIMVLDNGLEVELVGPTGNPAFCAACTRIRVGSDGSLLPCINWTGPPLSAAHCFSLRDFEEKVSCYVELVKRANRLREPKFRYPVRSVGVLERRVPRTLRLGLPKRDGNLVFTGPRAEHHLELYLKEWEGVQVLLSDS